MTPTPEKEAAPYCVEAGMKALTESPIVHVVSRGLAPFILLLGIYVFFHGHYSPGGGFQGGVLMAAGILLLRLALGTDLSQKIVPCWITLRLSAIGSLIFVGTGLVAIILSGKFLDYHYLPLWWLEPAWLRYYGILIVELGITMTVMTSLVAIYDDLLGS